MGGGDEGEKEADAWGQSASQTQSKTSRMKEM